MELKEKLILQFNQFKTGARFLNFETFNSGHINDTYLIKTNTSVSYVLQKINGHIFKNAIDVIENKVKLTKHLSLKEITTLKFVPTFKGFYYTIDQDQNYWNLSIYINNSHTHLKVLSNDLAYEAGRITGEFLANTISFKEKLIETLPNFHSMSYRYAEFNQALISASKEKVKTAQQWIDLIIEQKEKMLLIENAILRNKISLRVTHNDTKISNILFNSDNKAICLIDLDTIMPGCIHYDYGDALRTICNTAEEDETDLSKINFQFEYFKSYTNGFLENMKYHISKKELEYLPISISIMTFIIGLRFLTDYLNNNKYYKVKYPSHNLDRAINQFTFFKKIVIKQTEIENYIKNYVIHI